MIIIPLARVPLMVRRFLISVWVLGALPGCATNPVTGEQDFVLMSEEKEITLGREAHRQVLERYGGVYDDPDLQAYVQEVGEELAAASHRPELVYRFTVLDSTDVNAFALPGGYIYITRGLLAYLNTEAELAAVLGHEIGHVTARHSVRQISASQAAGIGYTLGAIFVPELRTATVQDLFNILGTALIRGYGRDMELEADRLGAEYLAREGYDPEAMLEVIGVLKDQEEFAQQLAREQGREPSSYHGVFATHPANDTRLQEVVGKAKALKAEAGQRVAREPFLEQLVGLVYGPGAESGVLRRNQFYHQGLEIALTLPEDWVLENRSDRLLAWTQHREALLQVSVQDINKRIPPREFMVQRLGLEVLFDEQPLTPAGLEGHTAVTDTRTPFGKRPARVTVIYYQRRAYIFLGAVEAGGLEPFDALFLATARSFHPLSEAQRAKAEPLRLAVVQAGPEMTFETLAAKSPLADHREARLRLLNQRYPDGQPAPGQAVKIVE